MDWIVLEPRRGKRPEENARVTIAWRASTKAANGGNLTGYVTVAAAVMAKLGWTASGKVEVAHDPAGTMLRVRLAPKGYRIGVNNGCGTFQAYLPWVKCGKQKATSTAFQVDGSVLLVTLPAWATKQGQPAPAKPAAMDAPSKHEQALSLLRGRVGTDQVCRQTGLSPREVVRLAEQVRAEREGKAA